MSVVRYPYLISKYPVSLTNGLHVDGQIRSLGLELGYSPSISLNETRLGRLAIPSPSSVKNGSTSNTTTGSKANRALDPPEINLQGRIGDYGSWAAWNKCEYSGWNVGSVRNAIWVFFLGNYSFLRTTCEKFNSCTKIMKQSYA